QTRWRLWRRLRRGRPLMVLQRLAQIFAEGQALARGCLADSFATFGSMPFTLQFCAPLICPRPDAAGAKPAHIKPCRAATPQKRQGITYDFAVSINPAAVLMTSKMVNGAARMSDNTAQSPRHFGPEIQGAIYLRGLGGAKPEIPTSFARLEARAQQ